MLTNPFWLLRRTLLALWFTALSTWMTACSTGGGMPSASTQPSTSIDTAQASLSTGKIYITNSSNNVLTTYTAAGTSAFPTIKSLSNPQSVAVDSAGKIYVANAGNNTLTTYTASGIATTPKITMGLSDPQAVAVDAHGKIYVGNGSGTLTTYSPNGARTTPTIVVGRPIYGVAVDAAGKIYVADSYCQLQGLRSVDCFGFVSIYSASGSPTALSDTIRASCTYPLCFPSLGATISGVSVEGGKIFVIFNIGFRGSLGTYTVSGATPTSPSIGFGSMLHPRAVTVDAAGKIYVVFRSVNTVRTYSIDGTPANPTITSGLNAPTGVAVH